MFFPTCFILNIVHTHKRPVNKLMAAFKGVFLGLFYKNTGLKSLFNITLSIRFFYRVYLCRLIININTLKKIFLCLWRPPFIRVRIKRTFVQQFVINIPSTTVFNFEESFFSNQSGSLLHAVRGHRNNSVRSDVLYKNNKKLFSICPAPLPPGQDRFKQFPTPGPEGLDLSPGLPGGGW